MNVQLIEKFYYMSKGEIIMQFVVIFYIEV